MFRLGLCASIGLVAVFALVSIVGCPPAPSDGGGDGDGNGVMDGIDREPNTREGATVDKWGVGLDGDKDGVPDGVDREPDTRQGALVDEWGVALDGDGDGVPDGIDLEPDTPAGSKVDQYGRAIIEEVRKFLDEGVITVHNIYFATGKTEITAESYPVIRTVAEIFARYPTLRIRIEGHTDSSGGRAVNMRISKGRAQAVLDQIMSFRPELDRARFVVEGFGPDQPIAPNDTAAGRKMNRRVDFNVINKEELKNLTE